jgi:hypothetical protein
MSARSALPSLPKEDAALLETLTPDLARILYPDHSAEPFSITATYPEFGGDAVRQLEATATGHEVSPAEAGGQEPRHRTTFSMHQIEEFHELYHLAEETIGTDNVEVLLNGRAVPLTRELWLPLLWTLRK